MQDSKMTLGCLTLALALLSMATSARALKFDYQIGNTSDANQIVVSDGGYTASASGWGGFTNLRNLLDPTDPTVSGAQNLGVNVGMALGFDRGSGCGTAAGITQ